jgi:hypothetical protein
MVLLLARKSSSMQVSRQDAIIALLATGLGFSKKNGSALGTCPMLTHWPIEV